jgi:hypothetical protein
LVSYGEINLIPSKDINKKSCFDLDNDENTDSNDADICLFQGPHANSPIGLAVINTATKYLLDKPSNFDDCKNFQSDFTETNIPDFTDWKICVLTNLNHLSYVNFVNGTFKYITQ